jgi:hypothetical protein
MKYGNKTSDLHRVPGCSVKRGEAHNSNLVTSLTKKPLGDLQQIIGRQVETAEAKVITLLSSILVHEPVPQTKRLDPPAHPAPGQVKFGEAVTFYGCIQVYTCVQYYN